MKKSLLTIAFITCLVTACSSTNNKLPSNNVSLGDLKKLHASSNTGPAEGVNAIRTQAIQDTAVSAGAQSGLAWRAKQINVLLQNNSKLLDQVYNFQALMLPDHVLPPVLVESEKEFKLDSSNTIRLADQTYVILNQARFVTTPPNWREYLWMSFEPPSDLPNSMLPKNAKEQEIWRQYVAIGWQQGIEQADTILGDNLARLTRDIKGMILYRKLLAQGMVSPPYVAKNALGVTGSGESIHINDTLLRITALPQLQVNPAKWHPVVEKQVETSDD